MLVFSWAALPNAFGILRINTFLQSEITVTGGLLLENRRLSVSNCLWTKGVVPLFFN